MPTARWLITDHEGEKGKQIDELLFQQMPYLQLSSLGSYDPGKALYSLAVNNASAVLDHIHNSGNQSLEDTAIRTLGMLRVGTDVSDIYHPTEEDMKWMLDYRKATILLQEKHYRKLLNQKEAPDFASLARNAYPDEEEYRNALNVINEAFGKEKLQWANRFPELEPLLSKYHDAAEKVEDKMINIIYTQ